MSLCVYVYGQRGDVERFYNAIIYPEIGRLRACELFRVTENNMKYIERNKTTHAVERQIRGYCPVQRWESHPEYFEMLDVEKEEPRRLTSEERVKDVQVKIALRGFHGEIEIFFNEIIAPKSDLFVIEKDTGLYTNMRKMGARRLGGHFTEKVEKMY